MTVPAGSGFFDAEERERASRVFRLDHDRIDFIAAHALLRRMLGFHLQRPAQQWRFDIGEFGRPAMAEHLPASGDRFQPRAHPRVWWLPLSSRAPILVSMSRNSTPPRRILRSQRTILRLRKSKSCVRRLLRIARSAFFRFWPLEEVCLKVIGTGFDTPLDLFAFTLAPIRIVFLRNAATVTIFRSVGILSSSTTPEHIRSIAVVGESGEGFRIVPRSVDPQEL